MSLTESGRTLLSLDDRLRYSALALHRKDVEEAGGGFVCGSFGKHNRASYVLFRSGPITDEQIHKELDEQGAVKFLEDVDPQDL